MPRWHYGSMRQKKAGRALIPLAELHNFQHFHGVWPYQVPLEVIPGWVWLDIWQRNPKGWWERTGLSATRCGLHFCLGHWHPMEPQMVSEPSLFSWTPSFEFEYKRIIISCFLYLYTKKKIFCFGLVFGGRALGNLDWPGNCFVAEDDIDLLVFLSSSFKRALCIYSTNWATSPGSKGLVLLLFLMFFYCYIRLPHWKSVSSKGQGSGRRGLRTFKGAPKAEQEWGQPGREGVARGQCWWTQILRCANLWLWLGRWQVPSMAAKSHIWMLMIKGMDNCNS